MKRPYKRRRLFLSACIRECFINIYRFFCFGKQTTAETHHNDPLVPRHTQNSVVAARASGTRVAYDKDLRIYRGEGSYHLEHGVKMSGTKKLLGGVKTQTSQLALNKITAICHNIPHPGMSRRGLPPKKNTPHQNDLTDKYWEYQMLFDMEMEHTEG